MSAAQEQEKTYRESDDSILCFNCHNRVPLDTTIECDVCGCLVCGSKQKNCVTQNISGSGYSICESCRIYGRSDDFLAAKIVERDGRIAGLVAAQMKEAVA